MSHLGDLLFSSRLSHFIFLLSLSLFFSLSPSFSPPLSLFLSPLCFFFLSRLLSPPLSPSFSLLHVSLSFCLVLFPCLSLTLSLSLSVFPPWFASIHPFLIWLPKRG